MKFLFVSAGVPSPIGQIHLLQLLKGLSREHQVTVVAFDLEEPYLADWREELNGLADVITVPLSHKSLTARAVRSLFSLVPVAVQAFCSEVMRRVIAEVVRDTEYDLVVFEQLVMGQYGSLARDLPKLFFPVDAVSRRKWQRLRVAANPLKKITFAGDFWMTKRFESRTYKQFDAVLFVSKVDAAYASRNRQASSSNIGVLPLALDTDYFVPGRSEAGGCPSLVFLGNMSGDNEDAILWFHHAVWPGLKRAVPELKLHIVGNSPTRKVQDLAASARSVVVTGYLRDIRPPLWNSTVFVSPLRMGTGINNRILQAMAMGKAIVASPRSVEGLDVEAGREVLVARDADSFRSQILFLLRSSADRERLGGEARRYIERNHSLRILAANFIQIASKITAERREQVQEPQEACAL